MPNDFKEQAEEEIKNMKAAIDEKIEQEDANIIEDAHVKATRQTDESILETFPEEQALVVEKLEEYWKEAQEVYIKVKEIRNLVDIEQKEPVSKWIFTQMDKYEAVERLKWLYQQIKRLERLKIAYEKKRIEALLKFVKFDTKEEQKKFNIDRMFDRENLLTDIALFDGIKLKGTGSRFMGRCPFHEEKTASFAIYSDNWFHCYGCQAHGNFLDYLMKTRNIKFKEALVEADRFL